MTAAGSSLSPKDGTVKLHDELVQMGGPRGLLHLAEALSRRMDDCEPSCEPLDDLVSRHSFPDQAGAFQLSAGSRAACDGLG